jgi:DNA-binding CsgD family transcriptional regulator
MLGSETLRSIALWKMEGYTNEEIAAKLGCVRFTVDRKLRAIRAAWSGDDGP